MKRAQDATGRSLRTLKVGEAMRHALADLLARGAIRDPVLDARIVSVSEVRVSPDLRHATAYIMPVGGTAEDEAAVLAALNAHARRIRHALAKAVNTKYAADIHFRADESFATGARIDALLRSPRVKRDLDATPPRRLDPDDEA
ncbi:30S ribosome-binding factor RbfA [Thermaurantiacus sp.]